MKSPFWIYRPLLNPEDVYAWLVTQKVKKAVPADQLHLTLATVREPTEWQHIKLEAGTIEIPYGEMPIQIFGWSMKAIAFQNEQISNRIKALARQFPRMDHARAVRPHLSTHKGGILPKEPYVGRLVFGPEEIRQFNEKSARDIPHIKLKDIDSTSSEH